jgi:hypothetical protein
VCQCAVQSTRRSVTRALCKPCASQTLSALFTLPVDLNTRVADGEEDANCRILGLGKEHVIAEFVLWEGNPLRGGGSVVMSITDRKNEGASA